MKKNIKNSIIKPGLIAAIYVVLTLILAPISFGPIQFRVSEILMLFAFFNPIYIIGLTLGCLLSNIFCGYGIMDIVFGTLATFLSVTFVSLTSKYIRSNTISLFIASLWPTIFNSIIVGWMLSEVLNLPFTLTALQVGIGEFVVVTILGVPVFKLITEKYKNKLVLQ